MGPKNTIPVPGLLCDLRDADNGRVGGENGLQGAQGIEFFKNFLLQLQILGYRLYQEVGATRRLCRVYGGFDPRKGRLSISS